MNLMITTIQYKYKYKQWYNQIMDDVDDKISTFYFYLFRFATRARPPQQRELNTAGPYNLTHPVHFPCERKPEYPEKTHDFRQRVDYTLFT